MNDRAETKPMFILGRLTRGEFAEAWRGLRTMARTAFGGGEEDYARFEDRDTLKAAVNDCIHARGGDVSARARTVELGTIYLHLSPEGREMFHEILSRDFDVDRGRLSDTIERVQRSEKEDERIEAEIALQEAVTAPRMKLLRQFSALPNGFKFLIDMRAEILPGARKDPHLRKLARDLKEILSSWFDVSLLTLQEITWQSPAAVLEKLIQYEAVHEIHSWDDLRKRLDSDRLCYAFFHHKMPTEPIIFVEVALVGQLSDNIQDLLEREGGTVEPETATTAIFYSISNTQTGLAGISLGNFLIKTVVETLMKERPQVRHFATLSPVPGFREWLDPRLKENDLGLLRSQEILGIRNWYGEEAPLERLHELLRGDWYEDAGTADFLRPLLLRLCARYLLEEKKGLRAVDPVENFHLSNGARLERLNWLADISENGMRRSYGIMANYLYKLSDIEQNHESYVTDGAVTASRSVRGLLAD